MKKPRATEKDFADLPRAKARKIARAANAIIDALWPLSQKQRREVVARIQAE